MLASKYNLDDMWNTETCHIKDMTDEHIVSGEYSIFKKKFSKYIVLSKI